VWFEFSESEEQEEDPLSVGVSFITSSLIGKSEEFVLEKFKQ